MAKAKDKPKKKVTAGRKGVNKKTAGKKGPKAYMNMVLIGLLMSLSVFSFAQAPNNLQVPLHDYQLVQLPGTATIDTGTAVSHVVSVPFSYVVIGITTYSPNINTYAPDVQYTTNYYYINGDSVTSNPQVTTPTKISQPKYIYGVTPGSQYINNILTSSIFLSGQDITVDSMYRTVGQDSGNIANLDSFEVVVYKKYNVLPRVIQVDGIDNFTGGSANSFVNKYARQVDILTFVPYPTF